MQAAFDTGPYLNVIECFVAEGSLLIFTCTKIHSAGKCPAEGLVSGEALAWVGETLGKRFHVLPPLSRFPLAGSKEKELLLLCQTRRLEDEKRRKKRRVEGGGAGEERRQEEGSA